MYLLLIDQGTLPAAEIKLSNEWRDKKRRKINESNFVDDEVLLKKKPTLIVSRNDSGKQTKWWFYEIDWIWSKFEELALQLFRLKNIKRLSFFEQMLQLAWSAKQSMCYLLWKQATTVYSVKSYDIRP